MCYVYVADLDGTRCVPERKANIRRALGENDIRADRIAVVIKEIESWYLAGTPRATCRQLHFKHIDDTEEVDKAKLKGLRPKGIASHVEFLEELLGRFKIGEAKARNNSFRHFMKLCGKCA
jgi:hypothetical protein